MLIIAHRGASAEAPENTIAAFKRALDTHADGIEIDVVQVGEEIYVFHDRYLRRLAAQPGRFTDLSPAQISQIRIFNQQPVPTLSEVIQLLRGRCMLNIELKGEVQPALLLAHLNSAVQDHQFQPQQLLISSFNHQWLATLKQLQPKLFIGALTAGSPIALSQFAADLQAFSVHIDVDFVTPEFVDDAHHRGLHVYVYTVDEPEDIVWLRHIGVDGIFTNHPQHSINVLAGLTLESPYHF